MLSAIFSGILSSQEHEISRAGSPVAQTRDDGVGRENSLSSYPWRVGRMQRKAKVNQHSSMSRQPKAFRESTASTVAPVSAPWPKGSRLPTARYASWDRKSDLLKTLATISGVKWATGGVRSSVLDWATTIRNLQNKFPCYR
jgi:hypothetical protein